METKNIHDAIHGTITVEDWQLRIIDTPQIQRLRRIKQLGFANLVYPGANHTRFEHSIGVMYIASKLAERLECDEDERMEIVAAALLHDVGHAPFSHSSELILRKYLRMKHEEYLIKRGGELKEVLKDLGLRVGRIAEHIAGKRYGVVSGDIDADRMDYLVRDSYHTGVAYGIFDLERLIAKIKFEGDMVIGAGGIRAAESLLISRFMMYPTVYFHHVCRIARKMYEKAVEMAVIEGKLDARQLLTMDDYDMVSFLRNAGGYQSEIMGMIDSRKLFKRALYIGPDSIDSKELEKLSAEKVEREIAEEAEIPEEYVLLDIPPLEEARELKALVEVEGDKKRLEDVSPLVRALKEAERTTWRLGVYTKPEYIERVEKAAIDFLGIERLPKQKRLDELPIW
jgi:hypothetical protein